MEVMKDAGKTVIIIAHRLSTVKHADRIIVLHNGEVKEEGTHEELSQKDGLYRKLWKEQFELSLNDKNPKSSRTANPGGRSSLPAVAEKYFPAYGK